MRKRYSFFRSILAVTLCCCILFPGMALAAGEGGYTYSVNAQVTPFAPVGKELLLRSQVVLNQGGDSAVASQPAYYLYAAADQTMTMTDGTALTGYAPVQWLADGAFYALSTAGDPPSLVRFGVADGRVEALDAVKLDQDMSQVSYWHGAAVLGDVVYVLWQPTGEAAGEMAIHAYDRTSGAFIEKVDIEDAEVITAAQDKLVVFLGSDGEYKCAAAVYDPADKSWKTVGTNSLEDRLTSPRQFRYDPVSGSYVITGTKGFYRWDLESGQVELVLPCDLSEGVGGFLFYDGQLVLEDDGVLAFPVK